MMNHEEKWLSIFKLCEYRAKRNAIKACANSDYSIEDTADNFMLDAANSFDKNRTSFIQNLRRYVKRNLHDIELQRLAYQANL